MSNDGDAANAAIYNLASLTILSAKDRKLVIELKPQQPIGKLDSGIDADKLLNDISAAFGMQSDLESNVPVPHINNVPIPAGIFTDVMKTIGELYMKDKVQLKLRDL